MVSLPKNLKVYIGLGIFAIVLVLIILWYRRRTQSKYTYTDIKAGTGPPETTAYSNILQCQITFNSANLTVTTDSARASLLTTLQECIRSNVNTYVDAKCTYITTDPGPSAPADVQTAFTAFTTDKNTIAAAYIDLLTRSDTTTSPTLEVVEAGLKADLTGASRKYLSAVCPDYFKSNVAGTITNPGAAGNGVYTTWRTYTTAPPATAYGFYPGATGKVTAAMVNTWAAKAARYTVDYTTNTMTVSTPYVASGSTYNDAAAAPNSDVKNWELYRDNGPGTNYPQK